MISRADPASLLDVARPPSAVHGKRLQLRGQAATGAQEHERVHQPSGSQHHHPSPSTVHPSAGAGGGSHLRGRHRVPLAHLLGVLLARHGPRHPLRAPPDGAQIRRQRANVPP